MLRAFIVDDEPPARARLRQLLTEAGDVVIMGEAADAIEARAAISTLHPDVVFLDIEMPQETGTALAGSLPEPRPFVVFATAFDHYALDAFAVDATDYLVKPITRTRLAATLTRVRERLSRRSDLERDLVAASVVQSMLLPRAFPIVDGYDSAALTVPARGVGGDFFLAQAVGRDHFVFALGDVSGKGMPAGLVASSLQARLETMAQHARASASEVVADVNRSLCATSDAARFATLAYVEFDGETGDLAFVNAGHLPPVLLTATGEVQWLPSTAPALGILPDASFAARAIALSAGDTLILYSDGVTECTTPDGDEFGDAGLLGALTPVATASADHICRAIVDAVRRHAGGMAASDDITVLVIKRVTGLSAIR